MTAVESLLAVDQCPITFTMCPHQQIVFFYGTDKYAWRHTFSLCLRDGGGLSLALCLFTSSSIVDLAWGWGECISRREGLAAGVGTSSTPLSPGDFLKETQTHSHKIKWRQSWDTVWMLPISNKNTEKNKICHYSPLTIEFFIGHLNLFTASVSSWVCYSFHPQGGNQVVRKIITT